MAATTALKNKNFTLQLLANDLNLKIGQVGVTIDTLQTGITNNTAFAGVPDLVGSLDVYNSLYADLQIIYDRVVKFKADLTIPT